MPVLAWATLIFALSSTPNLRVNDDALLDFVLRKLGHMATFGVLALLAWRALAATTRLRPAWAWGAGLALAYAVTDELHQSLTPGRHAAATDVLIDGLGIAFAIVGVLAVRRWRRQRRSSAG